LKFEGAYIDMNTYRRLIRVLLVVVAITWGSVLGVAQTKTSTAAKPKTPPQTQTAAPAQKEKIWIKDPANRVMPMRQMTNADHRAAAGRNRVRRAQHEARRKRATTNQGVQQ
jgi:hypothetical protein